MAGLFKGTGLLEVNIGTGGVSSKIGSGGMALAENLYDFGKRTVDFASIRMHAEKNDAVKGKASLNAYVYGDRTQENTAARLASGKDELDFVKKDGKPANWTAQTTQNGKGGRRIEMLNSGNDYLNAIQLGHEAYRDGVVRTEAEQKAETRRAVIGHAGMASRMSAAGIEFNGLLSKEIEAYNKGDFASLNQSADENYDSTADYFKVIVDSNGKVKDVLDDGDYSHINVYDEEGNKIGSAEKKSRLDGGSLAAQIRDAPGVQSSSEQINDVMKKNPSVADYAYGDSHAQRSAEHLISDTVDIYGADDAYLKDSIEQIVYGNYTIEVILNHLSGSLPNYGNYSSYANVAYHHNNFEIVPKLIPYLNDINLCTKKNETILHWAAASTAKNVTDSCLVKQIIDFGADKSIISVDGYTAYSAYKELCENPDPEILKLLKVDN